MARRLSAVALLRRASVVASTEDSSTRPARAPPSTRRRSSTSAPASMLATQTLQRRRTSLQGQSQPTLAPKGNDTHARLSRRAASATPAPTVPSGWETLGNRTRSSLGALPTVVLDLVAQRTKGRRLRSLAIRLLLVIILCYGGGILLFKLFLTSSTRENLRPSVARDFSLKSLPLKQIAAALIPSRRPVQVEISSSNADALVEKRRIAMKRYRQDMLEREPLYQGESKVISQAKGSTHEATVIFLHGIRSGAWSSPLPKALADRFPSVRWVHPQAAKRPMNYLSGDLRHAWFDQYSLSNFSSMPEDEPGMFHSVQLVNSAIRTEQSKLIAQLRQRGGINPMDGGQTSSGGRNLNGVVTMEEKEWANRRIILAGFGQGATLALLAGLTSEMELGGIVVLSGYLPLQGRISSIMTGLKRDTVSVFWGQGQADDTISTGEVESSISRLRAAASSGLGIKDVQLHLYPSLGHSIDVELEIQDMGNWIGTILTPFSLTGATLDREEPLGRRRSGKSHAKRGRGGSEA